MMILKIKRHRLKDKLKNEAFCGKDEICSKQTQIKDIDYKLATDLDKDNDKPLSYNAQKASEYVDNDLSDFIQNGEDLLIQPSEGKKKVILFWTKWYNGLATWEWRFGDAESYIANGCTKFQCEFTYDRERLQEAHAVLFRSDEVQLNDLPQRFADQRWVWVEVESPVSIRGINALSIVQELGSHNFNWTMSYHTSSDIMGMNGYLLPKGSSMPLRPNQLSYQEATVTKYLQAMSTNTTLADVMGPSWEIFVRRPRPVVWISSNCKTHSKREEYIRELSKYVWIDKYGDCGQKKCGIRYMGFSPKCWINQMRPKYMFVLAFENSLCDHYLSEKPYNPLIHGLVPIVWGGEGYDEFLPPGSYINSRHYHPKDLADLIKGLIKDKVAYGRYFVWRRYWKAKIPGSFCELCNRLHTDPIRGHHVNISAWRQRAERCQLPSSNMFQSEGWKSVIQQRR